MGNSKSSPFPFEQLPLEIQCMIFRCLPFRDRIRFERVCKDWQQLMTYAAYSHMERFSVVWHGDEISTGNEDVMVNSYKNSVAKISKYVKSMQLAYQLDSDQPIQEDSKILRDKRGQFRKMTSIITENDFSDLKSLALWFKCPSKQPAHKVRLDREAIISFMSKMKEIDLLCIEIAATDVDVWEQLTQHLRKIGLIGCRAPGLQGSSTLKSIEVYRSEFGDGNGSIDIGSFSGLTNIEEFRFQESHTMLTNVNAISSMSSLKVLLLGGILISNDDLKAIVQRCLMLIHVALYAHGTLLDQFWQLANLPVLVWLEFYHQPISNNDLQHICQNCKNLQTITLFRCENITAVTCVEYAKNLRIFFLICATSRTIAFPRRMPSSLEKIGMGNVQIDAVVSFPPGLRVIQWIPGNMSEKQFYEIVVGCPNLTRFAASLHINLDISIMQKLVGKWPKMQELIFLPFNNGINKDCDNYAKIVASHPKLKMFINRFSSLPSECRWIWEMIEARKS